MTRILAIAAGAAAIGCVILYLLWSRADERADRERDRADANAATVKAMVADADRANRIVADLSADLAVLQESDRDLRNAIIRAPQTSVCRASPAFQRMLDGVRREQGAPDPGRPATPR